VLTCLDDETVELNRTYDPRVVLVEREEALSALAASVEDAAAGAGRMVLISGEAGAGKTSLVRAAADGGAGRVLWGNCDGLLTPAPLGPFLDAVESIAAVRERLSTATSRHDFSQAVLGQLSAQSQGTLLVIEDAHWADGASIDLLRYLAPRVERTRGVLAVTYRDDELDRFHPLRALLGDVGHGSAIRRIRLRPLTARAVSKLAAEAGADGAEIFRLSGGNPYVVSELLADPDGAGHSVGEAVLARAARLPSFARAILDAASVMAEGAEPAVLLRLEEHDSSAGSGLDACVGAGLLVVDGTLIRFRHELARQAVEAALTPAQRVRLHAAVLEALLDSGLGEPARCAHHADAAGNRSQVLRFAPLAAKRAITLGSHPEAAAQLERAVRFVEAGAQGSIPADRAILLDQLAEQYLLLDRGLDARRASDEALGIWRSIGDPARLGECLRRRAEILRHDDERSSAVEAARAAVELLEPLGESALLARSYAALAQSLMLDEQFEQASTAATTASRLAEKFGHTETLVHAMTSLGSARANAGDESGIALIEESVARSRAAGLEADTVRAMNNAISMRMLYDRFDGLRTVIEDGVEYASERGLEVHMQCMRAALARLDVQQGGWDEAADIARRLVANYTMASAQRIEPLIVIGTLRARRGDPDAQGPLENALQLATRSAEPQHRYPAYFALAEFAWLSGQFELAASYARAAQETLAHAPNHPRQPEVAYWCWRTGIPLPPATPGREHPFLLQAAEQPVEAARAWHALGVPYQEADALADSTDEVDQRRAWAIFDSLGASGRAGEIARRLRASGARDVPRRLQTTSRANPGGLTDRQLEIAALIAEHLTNQEIAERLFLSPRTVDHHVSAILTKLSVANRRHAAQRVRELGLA
jgi:DNA-binding CsgD family transcriptional regulator/tetratricopeptide (TPR) repeat protein